MYIGRDFRSSKLWSATHLLSQMNREAIEVRKHDHSLLLLAALIYFVNSLHSRPDDSSYGRGLCRAIFPTTFDPSPYLLYRQQNDDEPVPYGIGGVMYLRPIALQPDASTIRFIQFRRMSDQVFKFALGCEREETTMYLFRHRLPQRSHEPGYVPQRKGFTKRRTVDKDQEVVRQFPEFEGTLEEVTIDNSEGIEVLEETIDIGECLENILQQFASDIMQKVGNPKGESKVVSYSPLAQDRRRLLSIEDIDTLHLGSLFSQVQWRLATYNEWQTTISRLFPDINHREPISVSHFLTCRYYLTYKELIFKLPADRRKEFNATLRSRISKLTWLPSTKADRLWDYMLGDDTWQKEPYRNHRGPKIMINPENAGSVDMTPVSQQDDETEEEESEESEDEETNTVRPRVADKREEEEESEESEDEENNIVRPLVAERREEEEESEESEDEKIRAVRSRVAVRREEEEDTESEDESNRMPRSQRNLTGRREEESSEQREAELISFIRSCCEEEESE